MKYDGGLKIFKLGHLVTEENIKIPGAHYSTETLMFSEKCVMHATSTVPKVLQPSQIAGPSLQPLIMSGSPRPGTIVSYGNYLYKTIDRSVEKPVLK